MGSFFTFQVFSRRWLFTELSFGNMYISNWEYYFDDTYFLKESDFIPFFYSSLGFKLGQNFIMKYNYYLFLNRDNAEYHHLIIDSEKSLLNGSLSFYFGFNKKPNDTVRNKNFKFSRHQLSLNIPKLQFGYEYTFLTEQPYNFSVLISSSFIPFKRYGYYSHRLAIIQFQM